MIIFRSDEKKVFFLNFGNIIIIISMPWFFIPRFLRFANVYYVRSGYDEDSETVNVLALNCRSFE